MGRCLAVTDNTAVHADRACALHSAAQAVVPLTGGCYKLGRGSTADDLTAVHIKEGVLLHLHNSTVELGHHVAAVQNTGVQMELTVTHPNDTALGRCHGVTHQTAGLCLAGIHQRQAGAGIVQRDHTGILLAMHLMAVQIQADLHIGFKAHLGDLCHIHHQLIVAGLTGQHIGSCPLAPGNGLVTMLALALMGEHIVGAVIQEDVEHLAVFVHNGVNTVIDDGGGLAAGLAGYAGHIVNAGVLIALQQDFHAHQSCRGVHLHHLAAHGLHIEAPAGCLIRQFPHIHNFGNEAFLVKFQTHEPHSVQLVDHLAVCGLHGDDLAILEHTDMEKAVTFGGTAGHTRLGLAVKFCSVQIPVDGIALGLSRSRGCHRRRSLLGRAAQQHQTQHGSQQNDRAKNANQKRLCATFLIFHKYSPLHPVPRQNFCAFE